jgi:hypothetical protein
MNEEKNRVVEVTETISRDFDKAGISSVITPEGIDNLAQLKERLTRKITVLIDTDYEKLLNILYRIDINENKLNKLFGSKNREYIPEKLADLIIERQLQKINFRNRYRNEKNNLP